jgi:hypothetical protein
VYFQVKTVLAERPCGVGGPFDPLTLLSDKYAKGAFFANETGMAGDEGRWSIAFRSRSTIGRVNAV